MKESGRNRKNKTEQNSDVKAAGRKQSCPGCRGMAGSSSEVVQWLDCWVRSHVSENEIQKVRVRRCNRGFSLLFRSKNPNLPSNFTLTLKLRANSKFFTSHCRSAVMALRNLLFWLCHPLLLTTLQCDAL